MKQVHIDRTPVGTYWVDCVIIGESQDHYLVAYRDVFTKEYVERSVWKSQVRDEKIST